MVKDIFYGIAAEHGRQKRGDKRGETKEGRQNRGDKRGETKEGRQKRGVKEGDTEGDMERDKHPSRRPLWYREATHHGTEGDTRPSRWPNVVT